MFITVRSSTTISCAIAMTANSAQRRSFGTCCPPAPELPTAVTALSPSIVLPLQQSVTDRARRAVTAFRLDRVSRAPCHDLPSTLAVASRKPVVLSWTADRLARRGHQGLLPKQASPTWLNYVRPNPNCGFPRCQPRPLTLRMGGLGRKLRRQ